MEIDAVRTIFLPNNVCGGEPRTGTLEMLYFSEKQKFVHRKVAHVRLAADVTDRSVVLVCTLDRPDPKLVPLLLLAACPLSMVVMMFAMRGMGSKNHDAEPSASPDPSVESLRARLAVVKDEERQLERELSSRSDESSDTGSGTPSTSPRAASS